VLQCAAIVSQPSGSDDIDSLKDASPFALNPSNEQEEAALSQTLQVELP
jgi:hypothetical protein